MYLVKLCYVSFFISEYVILSVQAVCNCTVFLVYNDLLIGYDG